MRKTQTRILSLLLVLSLCLALLPVFTLAAEQTETITIATDNPTASGNVWSWTHGIFTISVDKSSGSTAPTVNGNAKDLRVYANGKLTIEGENVVITKVVMNISTAGLKRLAPISADSGEIATQASGDKTVTWSGNSGSVTFTVGEKADYGSEGSSKAGQLDVDSIEITYTESGSATDPEDEYVAIYNPGSGKVMTTEAYYYEYKTKYELKSADATLNEDNTLTTTATDIALFKIETTDNGTTFTTEDGKYLFADGTDVKLVDEQGDNTLFDLEDAEGGQYIKCKTAEFNGNAQYIELYSNYFTVYKMGTDTAIYTFAFYPLSTATDPSEPTTPDTPEAVSTIADAVAAAATTPVTDMLGVVTFIETGTSSSSGDWTNVYIQDAKGENGICVRVVGEKLTYLVGDVLKVTGTRSSDFNGLPQVSADAGNVTSVTGTELTLVVNDTTLDKLTTADLCTYVHIEGLEVTAKSGTTITVQQNDTTMKIYNAVLGETEVAVGDTLEFKGTLSTYNGLQLRNTLASEIKVVSTGSSTTEPTESTETPETTETTSTTSNTYVLATEVKDGDQIILVNVAYNKAISAETNDSGYLLGVDVTPNSSKITTSNANIVWTVKVVDGGYQLVNADGKIISGTSGLGYGDADNVWVFEFDGNTLKIKSTTLVGSSGDSKYIEWYDTYSDFSTYYLTKSDGTANDPALFNMNVYVLDPDATPVTPSGIPASGDSSRLVLTGVVMVMAVAAAAALVTQRKRFF